MLFPIERLLEGRDAPLCVKASASVREALSLMIEHDYSQLPVISEDGLLVGIVSHEMISRRYYHLDGAVNLLGLSVDHCIVPAHTLTPDRDLLEALDRLKEVYAIVVTVEQRPVGILTDFDTTHFFRDLTEDLILVEDIEVTLRHYVEEAWPGEDDLASALIEAFGRRSDGTPSKAYERLTFHEHVGLLAADVNWEKLRGALEPKELFLQLMEQVRLIRNQLAHFRGETDPVQHDALVQARAWLDSRPDVHPTRRTEVRRVEPAEVMIPGGSADGKYEGLGRWLAARREDGDDRLRLGFSDIESVLGQPLPPSAREHRSWWANDSGTHRQSRAWLGAGWQVQSVDLASGEVQLKRTDQALKQVFFADLLEALKRSRPGITRANRTQAQNWWSFSGGRTGFAFGWVFDGRGNLRVELYIDTGDREANKAAFDALEANRTAIEQQLGLPLVWERLNTKRASRVYTALPVRVTDDVERLAQAKEWALDAMIRFVEAFQKRIAGV
jgi:CBS domain-containing protein